MADTILSRSFNRFTGFFTGWIPWHRLPTLLAIPKLLRIRERLRDRNLHDTSKVAAMESPPLGKPKPQHRASRTVDGTFNDLDQPRMGSAGTRFGRNVPLDRTHPAEGSALVTPSPRTVSLELMTRHKFQPATSLNLLAAAWIQFMVHDWLSHGHNEKTDPIEVPLRDDDDWPERPMLVRRTRRDPTRPPSSTEKIPTFLNTETHWWDGSQLYGSDQETMVKVRSGTDGKLTIGSDGLLPLDPHTGIDISGVTGNWWVGLSMLHTIFTLEHNAIADRLRAKFPSWSDDELFSHARLVNAALMAKIHTIEWTPAILAHPTVKLAMNGNWLTIPRSHTDHHGVPYSITEDFVAVYRMHPLMPDDYAFCSIDTGNVIQERTLSDVLGKHAREIMTQVSLTDLFYSFGIAHPGAITLHNYPRLFQRFERDDAPIIDLAAVDVLRDRERGVPLYNEFRKLIDLSRIETFEALTDNKEWAQEIRRVYDNNIDKVDLMVGLFAEPTPKGFGFSETAFRIFILMATRRLKSDRFFTTDYCPEVYTQPGLDWIDQNNMVTILQRHCPKLGGILARVKNAFAPWPRK
jgi:hypothetical protein